MMITMFLDHALSTLHHHKQKVTSTRRWLLEQLAQQLTPCNPYELLEQHPEANIDISTIYRNFELFESLGLIHKIHSLGGYIACKHHHDGCTEHDLIICKQCNSIEEKHIHQDTKELL